MKSAENALRRDPCRHRNSAQSWDVSQNLTPHRALNKVRLLPQLGCVAESARLPKFPAQLVRVSASRRWLAHNPFEPALNLLFSDAAGAANLYQHEVSFRSDAAIKAAGQSAIAGGDHRSHHPMPARDIVGFQRSLVTFFGKDAVISKDAMGW